MIPNILGRIFSDQFNRLENMYSRATERLTESIEAKEPDVVIRFHQHTAFIHYKRLRTMIKF